jgi:hypothetical protein
LNELSPSIRTYQFSPGIAKDMMSPKAVRMYFLSVHPTL